MTDVCSLGREPYIVLLNGGLGNQLCQFFFLKWLEIKTGKNCIASDYEFAIDNPAHNGYELQRIFGIKLKRMSEWFPPNLWHDMIWKFSNRGLGICQQLYDMGYPVTMVAETDDFTYNGNLLYMDSYDPKIVKAQGFLYFHGYWVHHKYFYDIYEEIKKIIQFPAIRDEYNLKYEKEIKNTKSVCIHIRRGDFVHRQWALPLDLYKRAISQLEKLDNNLNYFIFSDDIQYCKKNLEQMGLLKRNVCFIEGNYKENSYIDMQLMSMCKHRIVSNSSFSYLAALLREDRDGIILSLGTKREF